MNRPSEPEWRFLLLSVRFLVNWNSAVLFSALQTTRRVFNIHVKHIINSDRQPWHSQFVLYEHLFYCMAFCNRTAHMKSYDLESDTNINFVFVLFFRGLNRHMGLLWSFWGHRYITSDVTIPMVETLTLLNSWPYIQLSSNSSSIHFIKTQLPS